MKTINEFIEISKDQLKKALKDKLIYGEGILRIHNLEGDIVVEHILHEATLKSEKDK